MILDFCALRFCADENLSDRIYWYRTDFPVQVGEWVLAPVGPNDRLQLARVERSLRAREEAAPYPLALIKQTAAKRDARRLLLPSGLSCRELGGVPYDRKHYTRYGVFLYAPSPPAEEDGVVLAEYGVCGRAVFEAAQAGASDKISAAEQTLSGAKGCVLLCGEAALPAAWLLLVSAGVSPSGAAEALGARGTEADLRARAEAAEWRERMRSQGKKLC